MKGRVALPDGVKALSEEVIEQTIPECPPYLTGIARAEWDKCILELVKMKIVTNIDQTLLAAYCHCFEQWRKLADIIDREGVVLAPMINMNAAPSARIPIARLNPAAKAYTDVHKQLLQYAKHFGFTPSTRKGMKLKDQRPKDHNGLQDFSTNNMDDEDEE